MKKCILIIVLLSTPFIVYAGRGCCSHHGGECGCSSYGRSICCDGTTSPSCACNPPKIYGCTDPKADNYNAEANTIGWSCGICGWEIQKE